MTKEEQHEILKNTCDCAICMLAGQMISFAQSLLGPREMQMLKAHVLDAEGGEVLDSDEIQIEPAMGLILVSALTEIAFKSLIPPDMICKSIESAYTLRCQKLFKRMHGNPEMIEKVTALFHDTLSKYSEDSDG